MYVSRETFKNRTAPSIRDLIQRIKTDQQRNIPPVMCQIDGTVENGVYIGSVDAVGLSNLDKLHGNKIKHIVSILAEYELPIDLKENLKDFQHTHIDCEDVATAQIGAYFLEVVSAIDEALKDNASILVHCRAGVSRSATLVTAWLIRRQRLSREQAIDKIRAVWPRIRINSGYLSQLDRWQTYCESLPVDGSVTS